MNKLTALAFVLLCASVSPVLANKDACAAGKSDGQIILELKDQVDNEFWNDLRIRRNWFGIGVVTGGVITAALMAKYCGSSRR
jgi:hypothetical protein